MDAAEIARLRGRAGSCGLDGWEVDALLDALDQALEECEALRATLFATYAQRDQAQKDAKDARAMLAEIGVIMEGPDVEYDDIRCILLRIEAMLEQKP